MGDSSNIEAIMAQLQELQGIVAAMGTGDSGLDFSGMMGSDDDVIPNVPIGGGGMANFDIKKEGETTKIGKGVVCVGRKHYRVGEAELDGDGEYRLTVELSEENATITVGKGDGFEAPKDEKSYIPLYKVKDGGIAEDYRSNFCVVARE